MRGFEFKACLAGFLCAVVPGLVALALLVWHDLASTKRRD